MTRKKKSTLGRVLLLVVSSLAVLGLIDVVSTAAPGIRDLLALGKIRQLEQLGTAEVEHNAKNNRMRAK
mgnify:CR=1 FL=1